VSNRNITSTVSDDNNVLFGENVCSPSMAAVLANAERGGTATAISGPISWRYNGETLASIREQRLAPLEG